MVLALSAQDFSKSCKVHHWWDFNFLVSMCEEVPLLKMAIARNARGVLFKVTSQQNKAWRLCMVHAIDWTLWLNWCCYKAGQFQWVETSSAYYVKAWLVCMPAWHLKEAWLPFTCREGDFKGGFLFGNDQAGINQDATMVSEACLVRIYNFSNLL